MAISEHHLVLEGALRPEFDLSERAGRRRRLERLLEELGRTHARALRTPLDFSSGEIFQALVREPRRLLPLLAELRLALHDEPHQLGLGFGELTTPLSGRVRRMDGPCFDAARAARREAERTEAWVRVLGFGATTDRILNGQFLLLGQVQGSWKPKQLETIRLMRRLGRRKEVARARGVLPSTVSRSLDGAFYDGARGAEEAISLILHLVTSGAILDPEGETR